MLKFELTIEEANVILSALAKEPFQTVAELIGKLRNQAQPQIDSQNAPPVVENES
jgi:hypothetical protein